MNNENKIQIVADRVPCKKHAAPEEVPWWAWYGGLNGQVLVGVCGRRAKQAGFVGRVKRSSLVRTPFKATAS